MADTRWLNTSGFSGLNDELLLRIRDAGFSQIDASSSDFFVDPIESGLNVGEKYLTLLQRYGLHLTHLRTVENFIGAPHVLRWQKREEVRQQIALSLQVGCDTLLVTPPEEAGFVEALVDDDLRWLASEAARFSMKIIYQPLSCACIDTTLSEALQHLRQLDQPNIGLLVDGLSIVAGGSDAGCLDTIPVEWIYSVQFCDPADLRLSRCDNPQQALNCFTDKLHSSGYQGPVGILPNPRAGAAAEQIRQAMTMLNALWPEQGGPISAGQE